MPLERFSENLLRSHRRSGAPYTEDKTSAKLLLQIVSDQLIIKML